MRALVTAFDPFGGESINASFEAVQRLPQQAGALNIATAVLSTSYARSLSALEEAIARVKPEIVLCVGQAGERAALCMERVAVNLQDAEIADNDGARPIDQPVVAGGPAAYLATLPVRAAVAALRAQQMAHWPVYRDRVASRLDGAKGDAAIGIGGETAAQVHVGLLGILLLVEAFRRGMPDIDLRPGDRLAVLILDVSLDEDRRPRRRRTDDGAAIFRARRIHPPERSEQIGGGFGLTGVAVVE